MAPLRLPVGEHPDGDPFAELDRQREANTVLGRMEARAREEAAAEEATLNGLPSPSFARPQQPPQSTRSSSRSTPVVNYGGAGRRSRSSAAAPQDGQPASTPVPAPRSAPTSRNAHSNTITIESSDDEAAPAEPMAVEEATTPAGAADPDALEDEEGDPNTPAAAAEEEQDEEGDGEEGEGDDDEDDEEDGDEDEDGDGEGSDDQDGPQSEEEDDDDESDSGSEDLGSDDDDEQVGSQLKRKRESSAAATSAKRRLVDSPNGPSSAPTSDNEGDTSLAFSTAGPADSPAVIKKKPKRAVLSSLGRSISAQASDDPTSAAASPAGSGAENDATGAKPKRKYKYKAAVVPEKPKVVKTIRLELKLAPPGTNPTDGAPQFSVVQLAKEAGLVSDDEAKAPAEEEHSEGGSGEDDDEDGDDKEKKDDKDQGEDKMEGVEGAEPAAVPVELNNGTGPVVLAPVSRFRHPRRLFVQALKLTVTLLPVEEAAPCQKPHHRPLRWLRRGRPLRGRLGNRLLRGESLA